MIFRLALIVGLLFFLVQVLADGPRRGHRRARPGPDAVRDPQTGKIYQFVPAPEITWQEARQRAGNATFANRPGYLATVTSKAEENFLRRHFHHHQNLWIGATDEEEEGVWQWVTGPEAGVVFFRAGEMSPGFSNWDHKEPNNMHFTHEGDGGEDYAMWNWRGTARWNDGQGRNHDGIQGYLVEYEPGTLDDEEELQLLEPRHTHLLRE